jgi:hypothetical protein
MADYAQISESPPGGAFAGRAALCSESGTSGPDAFRCRK